MSLAGITLETKEGTKVPAAEALRGKIVVLFFSSEWCPACKLFVPTLCAAPQTHHADPQPAAVACTLLVAPSPLCSRDRPGTRCTKLPGRTRCALTHAFCHAPLHRPAARTQTLASQVPFEVVYVSSDRDAEQKARLRTAQPHGACHRNFKKTFSRLSEGAALHGRFP